MNRTLILYLNVLIIATCGLVYELLSATLASYLLGDSITQFSLIIGIYLFAMGVGAWLSQFIDDNLARCFIDVELGVALLGGVSAPLLFLSFGYRMNYFHVLLYGNVFCIGVLVGLELPLLMRIIKQHLEFKELVSHVLAFDYVGALFASILFPIFLVPKLGLIRTSLAFGMLNALVAFWGTWILRDLLPKCVYPIRIRALLVLVLLAVGIIKADALTRLAEEESLGGEILFARTTPFQRIVVTRAQRGFHLYLQGHHQFSSVDEYRYHEALVHPAMALVREPSRVLILGGGDGLALREVLKYPGVRHVTLVDIDPEMTNLSRHLPMLADLNEHAYDDPRVEVVNQDAMTWLELPGPNFDVIIIDFPDPSSFSLGKLYTTRFYRLMGQRLNSEGAVGIQSTSPLFSRRAFWCVIRTMEAAGLTVRPYHIALPSFRVWGFGLAKREAFELPSRVLPGLRFLTDDFLPTMFVFPRDLEPVEVEINRLDNQILVRYHDADWRSWE